MKPTLKKLLNEETSKIWDYVNSKSEIKIVPDYDYSVNIIENDNNKAIATIWIDSEDQIGDSCNTSIGCTYFYDCSFEIEIGW